MALVHPVLQEVPVGDCYALTPLRVRAWALCSIHIDMLDAFEGYFPFTIVDVESDNHIADNRPIFV